MKRVITHSARAILSISFVISQSATSGQEQQKKPPIKEYYNTELAIKHLVPDREGREDPRFSDRITHVSMVNLLANPNRYHGKAVRVEGALRVGFEENALYLSKDDAAYLITKNGFWLTFGEESWKDHDFKLDDLDRKFVLIEGIFDKDFRGHLGANSGSIREVWRVQELR